MDTLEEPHLSALLATATYLLQSELTETTSLVLTYPTLPGRYTCMSSSRSTVPCRLQAGRQADRQNLPDKGPTMDFYTALACSTALYLTV